MLMTQLVNIEDCLELLAGLRQADVNFNINNSDVGIMQSIARQVFKGTALTDRQYELVKNKLLNYKEQFEQNGHGEFELALGNLRLPLRKIDRSKYIKIVETSEVQSNRVYESFKENWKWIKIRFPFSKKDIVRVEEIIHDNRNLYLHFKGSHEHYFKLNEKTAYRVVETFKDKNFEIDPELLDLHREVSKIAAVPQEHVPGIFDLELRNVNSKVKDYLEQQFGSVSIDNLAVYKDRSLLFGLQHFDEIDLHASVQSFSTLSKSVINRSKPTVFVDSNRWRLEDIAQSISELDRYPLLVMLEEKTANTDLVTCHSIFRNLVSDTETSVMFRLDENQDRGFNDYVKNKHLNNYVDKNTKIVYISKSKLPKPLVGSGWKPSTVLQLRSIRAHSKVQPWLITSDLIIHYDSELSPWSAGISQIERL